MAAIDRVAVTPEDFITGARQLRTLLEEKEAAARTRPVPDAGSFDSMRGALNRAVLALEETDAAAAAAAQAAAVGRQAASAADEAASAADEAATTCARRVGACRRALLEAQGELRLEGCAGEATAAEPPVAKKRRREIRLALLGEQGALSLARLEAKLREETALRQERDEELARLRVQLGITQANLRQAEDDSAIKDSSAEKLEKCFGKNKWHGMVKDWALCVETARNEENMRSLADKLRQRTKDMVLEAQSLATKLRQRGCEDLASEVERGEYCCDDLASELENALEVSPAAAKAAVQEVITRLGIENNAYRGHCETVGAPVTDAATGRLTRGGNACVSAAARASSGAERPRDAAAERRRAAGPVPKF